MPKVGLKDGAETAAALKDGLKDGIITDPRACSFDPATLQCPAGAATPDCLTAPQVEAARKIYTGAKNSRGELIFSPLFPGSELGWASSAGAQPVGYAIDVYRYVVMRDATWQCRPAIPHGNPARVSPGEGERRQSGTRVAIVGGTGTLGRQVTEELRARGHEARVISRNASDARFIIALRCLSR